MRRSVLLLLATTVFVFAVRPPLALAVTDPSTRYTEAFILAQQARAAEESSDFTTAFQKYTAASQIMHAIRTESPDWNAQMVEYRLKECDARAEALKDKVPAIPPPPAEPPPAPTEVVTPAVAAPPPSVPTPQPILVPAPVEQSSKSQAKIDKLEAENRKLKSNLSEAKSAPKPNPQLDKLAKENKDLKAQLAAKQAAPPKPPPPVTDSGELKKLRAELDKARSETQVARKSAAEVPGLQKQNKDLSAQLAAAGKKAAAKSPPPPPVDSAEVKKLRADLTTARADAENAKKTGARATELERQNKDLSTQLADAEKKAALKLPPVTDSGELKKLRADLESARAEGAQAKKQAARVADLENQNKDLSSKLAAAEKRASAKPTPAPAVDTGELKKLRAEAGNARAEADAARKSAAELEKKNKDLAAKLSAAEKKAAESAAGPSEPPDARIMKKLREENSYLRNLLDNVATKNPELKGQLRRYE